MESGRDDCEPFHCGNDRNSRSDHSVAIKKRGAEQPKHNERLAPRFVALAPVSLENERQQSQHSALAAVVSAKNEKDVLEADNQEEGPDYQGQHAIDVAGARKQPVLLGECFPHRVERAGADVAVNHSEGDYRQLSQSLSGRMRLRVSADVPVSVMSNGQESTYTAAIRYSLSAIRTAKIQRLCLFGRPRLNIRSKMGTTV